MDQTSMEGSTYTFFKELVKLCKLKELMPCIGKIAKPCSDLEGRNRGEHKGFLSPFSRVGSLIL